MKEPVDGEECTGEFSLGHGMTIVFKNFQQL